VLWVTYNENDDIANPSSIMNDIVIIFNMIRNAMIDDYGDTDDG